MKTPPPAPPTPAPAPAPTPVTEQWFAEFKPVATGAAITYTVCLYAGDGFDKVKNKVDQVEGLTARFEVTGLLTQAAEHGDHVAFVGRVLGDGISGEYSDPQWIKITKKKDGGFEMKEVKAPKGVKNPTIGDTTPPVAPAVRPDKAEFKLVRHDVPAAKPAQGTQPSADDKSQGAGAAAHTAAVEHPPHKRGTVNPPPEKPGSAPVVIPPPDDTKKNASKGGFFKNNKFLSYLLLLIALLLLGLLIWSLVNKRNVENIDEGSPSAASAIGAGSKGTVKVGNIEVGPGHSIGVLVQHFGTEISVNNNYMDPARHSLRPASVGPDGKLIPSEIVDTAEAARIAQQFAPPAVLSWPRDFHPTREIKLPCEAGAFADMGPGSSIGFSKAVPDAKTLPANAYWRITTEKDWALEIKNSDNDLEVVVNGIKVQLKDGNVLGDGMIIEFRPRRSNESVALDIMVHHLKK